MATQPIKLTVGGDVQASNGTYLPRNGVDEELLNACLSSEFACVLASRQMGKSSLKNAIAEQLTTQGIKVVRIDLNRIGQNIQDAEIWYFNLLEALASGLQLIIDIEIWWDSQYRLLTPTQKFLKFIDEVILIEISQPIVIFIDEIDVTLGLPFTDDFFAVIRTIHNDRAQHSAFKRLTFVLLGLATPDDLISDPSRTPFNIGRAISIRDFTQAECEPLRLAIAAKHPTQSEIYFQQIYDWTDGHPYLTQKLCALVASNPPTDDPDLINMLVNQTFLAEEDRAEDNLRFVQSRVLKDSCTTDMLQIYKKVLQGETVFDNEKSLPINRLKLYGLVVVKDGRLKVRNRIYRNAFNLAWTQAHFPPPVVPYGKIAFMMTFIVFIPIIMYFAYKAYIVSQCKNSAVEVIQSGDFEGARAYKVDPNVKTGKEEFKVPKPPRAFNKEIDRKRRSKFIEKGTSRSLTRKKPVDVHALKMDSWINPGAG